MGVKIFTGDKKRNWGKIASAGAEAIVQATLVTDGISNSVSALFRTMEGLRAEESVEHRATTLISETIVYATAVTFAKATLERAPAPAELKAILESSLNRAETYAKQKDTELDANDLEFPAQFVLFEDAASQIHHDLKTFTVKESKAATIIDFVIKERGNL